MTDIVDNQQIPTPRTSLPTTPTDIKTGLDLDTHDTQIILTSSIDEISCENGSSLSTLRNLVPYKTSMATITFNGTIWEKIDAVAKAGFDAIEIMTPDLEETTPRELYQYCKSKNLKVSVLQPFRDLEGYDDESKFQKKLEELENTFEVMKELHTDLLMCCANCLPESEISLNESTIVRQLATAAELAAKYNIRLAYENLSWATHINTLDSLCNIVKKVNRSNFGACLDAFHINIHNSSLEYIDEISDKIFFVQYCDAPILRLNSILEYARNYRVFPGQGEYTNMIDMLEKIHTSGYNGYLSLEVFNASFKENTGNCEAVADDALRGLLYLQAMFCDRFLGMQILPSLKVEYASINKSITPETGLTLADLTLHMDEASQEIFRSNCSLFGNQKYCKTQPFSTDVSKTSTTSHTSIVSRIIMTTNNRLDYNRQCLLIRTVFGMVNINNDPYNDANEFGLPNVSTFGYSSGGLIITLALKNN